MIYGGLGVVAGHELTHGFDDGGVQWNGTGTLVSSGSWMDANSYNGFHRMAACVINEYNGFCPLQGTSLQPQCINGAQTQGENIADNGGIHASWRAYKTWVGLNGPDPRMPAMQGMNSFTHDQLFFLNFARVWCRAPPPNYKIQKQLLNDPHSPARYRVFGTIQNFPAFRTAFNCPVAAGSYAPPNGFHCNVWVGDN